jgi:hypothetical protein
MGFPSYFRIHYKRKTLFFFRLTKKMVSTASCQISSGPESHLFVLGYGLGNYLKWWQRRWIQNQRWWKNRKLSKTRDATSSLWSVLEVTPSHFNHHASSLLLQPHMPSPMFFFLILKYVILIQLWDHGIVT